MAKHSKTTPSTVTETDPARSPRGWAITAKAKAGMRRAGMFHPGETVVHPEGTLTLDQVDELLAEPGLTVKAA